MFEPLRFDCNSISGQWRPWSDCTNASLHTYGIRDVFICVLSHGVFCRHQDEKNVQSYRGSNLVPSDYRFDALPTAIRPPLSQSPLFNPFMPSGLFYIKNIKTTQITSARDKLIQIYVVRKTGSVISTTLIQGFNFTNSWFQLHEFTNSTSRIHEFNFTNSTSRIQQLNSWSWIREFLKLNSWIREVEFVKWNSWSWIREFMKLNSWIREVEFVKLNSWNWIREFMKLNSWIREVEFVNSWSWIREVEFVKLKSWIREVEIVNSWSWNREFMKLKPWINVVEMSLSVFRNIDNLAECA